MDTTAHAKQGNCRNSPTSGSRWKIWI